MSYVNDAVGVNGMYKACDAAPGGRIRAYRVRDMSGVKSDYDLFGCWQGLSILHAKNHLPLSLFSYCAISMDMLVPRGQLSVTFSESQLVLWNVFRVPDNSAVSKQDARNLHARC